MLLLDSATHEPWDADNANAMLQHFRAQCVDAMRKRDEIKSGGRMNAENDWSTMRLSGEPDDPATKMVVDPELAALKHSGEDTEKVLLKMWAEFCSEPRDQKQYVAQFQLERRIEQAAERAEKASAVVAELDSMGLMPKMPRIDETSFVRKPIDKPAQPPKRKRGRPRKNPDPEPAEV